MEEKTYKIEKKVLTKLIKKEIKQIEGVWSVKKGLFGDNIQIKQTPEGTEIKIGLVVKKGNFIPTIVEEVQKRIKEEIEENLGIKVKKIDVIIKGIKFIPKSD